MTTRADFSDAEWRQLTEMPRLAAFGAMAAEDSGPVTSTRELWAGMHALVESAKTTYPDNALIQAVTRSITHREDESELSIDDWQASGPEALHEAIVEQTLATATNVRQILATKVSVGEAAAYTSWIIGVARASIKAAKTGFLGMAGAMITPRESRFMSDLASALGVSE